MTLESDLEQILDKLNQVEKYKYKGQIHMSAKGEAQIEIRVSSDSLEEVEVASDKMTRSLIKVCKDNNVPIAGAGG